MFAFSYKHYTQLLMLRSQYNSFIWFVSFECTLEMVFLFLCSVHKCYDWSSLVRSLRSNATTTNFQINNQKCCKFLADLAMPKPFVTDSLRHNLWRHSIKFSSCITISVNICMCVCVCLPQNETGYHRYLELLVDLYLYEVNKNNR